MFFILRDLYGGYIRICCVLCFVEVDDGGVEVMCCDWSLVEEGRLRFLFFRLGDEGVEMLRDFFRIIK